MWFPLSAYSTGRTIGDHRGHNQASRCHALPPGYAPRRIRRGFRQRHICRWALGIGQDILVFLLAHKRSSPCTSGERSFGEGQFRECGLLSKPLHPGLRETGSLHSLHDFRQRFENADIATPRIAANYLSGYIECDALGYFIPRDLVNRPAAFRPMWLARTEVLEMEFRFPLRLKLAASIWMIYHFRSLPLKPRGAGKVKHQSKALGNPDRRYVVLAPSGASGSGRLSPDGEGSFGQEPEPMFCFPKLRPYSIGATWFKFSTRFFD